MKKIQKSCALFLALIMLFSCIAVFTGCSETTDDPAGTESETATEAGTEEATEEEDHRFDGVNYNDREFRIYTSTNQAGATLISANFLIEGTGELGGGLVNDSVVERNTVTEELLGIKLVYTHLDAPVGQVSAPIRKIATSGMDEFDLVINDGSGIIPLIIEGNFRNVIDDECVFDFERDYWYKDYMEDLRLMDGYQYLLAGDYFIDVLRTAHILLLNKEIYKEQYKASADEIYDWVVNYEWTYEKLNTIISDIYVDKNGDGKKGVGDRIGLVIGTGTYGNIIGPVASGIKNFISRDEDGIPSITIHEGDLANQLGTAISTLFNNDSTVAVEVPVVEFSEGTSLMAVNALIGSLENDAFRSMKDDAAVLPFPMLFASDKKYTTATHDTSEMGAILTTSTDLAFISTVIEVLNRESARTVLPKYYSESLKLQVMDDEKSAEMLDIVHDNFDNAFILAYSRSLSTDIFSVYTAVVDEKREFSAVYAKDQKKNQIGMERMIAQFQKNNAND